MKVEVLEVEMVDVVTAEAAETRDSEWDRRPDLYHLTGYQYCDMGLIITFKSSKRSYQLQQSRSMEI
jgi:hypothetical protein